MSDSSELQIDSNNVMHIIQRYYREFDERNIEILSHDLSAFSNNTQGFLSHHRFLSALIRRKTKNGVMEEKLKFFAKLAPVHSAALLQYVVEFDVFEKETKVYRLLLPRLQAINFDVEFIPKCYMAKSNFLIFENLGEKHFRLGSSADGVLDYDHLKVALKSLAAMHSSSIILESRMKRSLLELYPRCLKENSYPKNIDNQRVQYVHMTIRTLCSLVPLIAKYSKSSELSRITDKLSEVLSTIFALVKPSDTFLNVASHGDLWANNLLFRYDGKNANDGKSAKPVECRLVDFQLARYSPPALDVMTLLTIPTTSSFRKKHLSNLLDDYYTFMQNFLAEHSVDVESVFSRKEFDKSVNQFKLAGLIESCFFSHITLLPPEIADSISQNSEDFQQFLSQKRIDLCSRAFQANDTYRNRLTDMMCALIDEYVV